MNVFDESWNNSWVNYHLNTVLVSITQITQSPGRILEHFFVIFIFYYFTHHWQSIFHFVKHWNWFSSTEVGQSPSSMLHNLFNFWLHYNIRQICSPIIIQYYISKFRTVSWDISNSPYCLLHNFWNFW